MTQEEIRKRRKKIEAEQGDIRTQAKQKMDQLNAELQKLQEKCTHPNTSGPFTILRDDWEKWISCKDCYKEIFLEMEDLDEELD